MPNFKSNASYKAWLAYGHASGAFERTPGNQPVSIKGKSHTVKHKDGGPISLPEDQFMKGGEGIKDSLYASTSGLYPANYGTGGQVSHLFPTNTSEIQYKQGGSMNSFYASLPGNYYAGGGKLGEPTTTPTNNPPKKMGVNERTAVMYQIVSDQVAKLKAEGVLGPDETLNVDGVMAQILLESANGTSDLAQKANNFGGIKADTGWQGAKSPSGRYRAYSSMEEGLREQVNFYVQNPRYKEAGVFNAKTPKEHLQAVQKGGYAEEPTYVDRAMQMVNSLPKRLAKVDPSFLQKQETLTEAPELKVPESFPTLNPLGMKDLSERPLVTQASQTNFIPQASAPNQIPDVSGMKMNAPKGWFGSGKTIFNDGGNMEQLTHFNEGGRHEENPLGGIPQGVNPDGQPNLVEQGETKLNSANYIYSDSLKVDGSIAKQFNLSKSDIGKTFAEVSKKMNRPNSRRENDSIEKEAIKRDLDSLMQAQETFKKQEVEKKMAEIQSLDPSMFTAPQQSAPQMPVEQPPMDPSMMGQPMMRQGGHMFNGGGSVMASPYADPNSLESQGFRDFSSGTAATPETPEAGGNMMGQAGQYVGLATSVAGMAGTLGNNQASDAQKGDAVYNTAKGAVSTINPVVGGLIGLGDMIGDPIRKSAEKTDEQGNLENKQGAKAGYIANTVLNPMKNMSNIYTDKDIDTKRKVLGTLSGGISEMLHADDYADDLEKDKRRELGIAEPEDQAYVATNGIPLQQTFKGGGFMYPDGGPLGANPTPAIWNYRPKVDPNYPSYYNTELARFKANPIDPKTGAPMIGSGGMDSGSTGTGGNYRPMTAEERAAKIAEIDAYKPSDINNQIFEKYAALKNPKHPYFINEAGDKELYEPINLGTWAPTVAKTKPAPAVNPIIPAPNTVGQVLNPLGQSTGLSNVDATGNTLQVNKQMGQMAEGVINSPEAILQRRTRENSNAMQTAENTGLVNTLSPEILQKAKEAKTTPANYMASNPVQMRAGGHIYDGPTEPTNQMSLAFPGVNPNAENEVYSTPTDTRFAFQGVNPNAESEVWGDVPGDTRGKYSITDEELKMSLDPGTRAYIERQQKSNQFTGYNSGLDEGKSQFSYNQSLGNAAMGAIPLAYNLYQGTFGKVAKTPRAEDLYERVNAYKMNINPQIEKASQTFAQGQNAIRNAAIGGGDYLSNMQQMANTRNQTFSELYAQKENQDAQNQMRADMFNAQNKGHATFQAYDLEARAKAAKQKYLETGLAQLSQMGQSNKANELAGVYNSMAAPDFSFTYTPWMKGQMTKLAEKTKTKKG